MAKRILDTMMQTSQNRRKNGRWRVSNVQCFDILVEIYSVESVIRGSTPLPIWVSLAQQ